MISEISNAAGGPGLSVKKIQFSIFFKLTLFYTVSVVTCFLYIVEYFTKNVDVNGCSSTAASVHRLNNVRGRICSGRLGDRESRMTGFCINRDSVIWLEDKISFCPFDSRVWFSENICWKVDLRASFSCQAGQQFGIQMNDWRLCDEQRLNVWVRR